MRETNKGWYDLHSSERRQHIELALLSQGHDHVLLLRLSLF